MDQFVTGKGVSCSQDPLSQIVPLTTQQEQREEIQVEQEMTRSTTNENDISMQQMATPSQVVTGPLSPVRLNDTMNKVILPTLSIQEIEFSNAIIQKLRSQIEELCIRNEELQRQNAELWEYVNCYESFFQVQQQQVEPMEEQRETDPLQTTGEVIKQTDDNNPIYNDESRRIRREKDVSEVRPKAPKEARTTEIVRKGNLFFRPLFPSKKTDQLFSGIWSTRQNRKYGLMLDRIISRYKLKYCPKERITETLKEVDAYFKEMNIITDLNELQKRGAVIANYIQSKKVNNLRYVEALRKYCNFVLYVQNKMKDQDIIVEVQKDLRTIIERLEEKHTELGSIENVENKAGILLSIVKDDPEMMASLIRKCVTQDIV